MPRSWLAFAALALLACARDPIGMNDQKRFRSYGRSSFFADGRQMRPLVAGTVSRERPRGAEAYLTGREDGHEVDRFPLPLTRDLIGRGRHDFEIYCAACHGLIGDGNSRVAAKMSMRLPPSLIDERQVPGHVFVVISEGYGLMAPYADDVPIDHRWGIAAYLEALRRSQRVRVEEAPPEIRSQLTGTEGAR